MGKSTLDKSNASVDTVVLLLLYRSFIFKIVSQIARRRKHDLKNLRMLLGFGNMFSVATRCEECVLVWNMHKSYIKIQQWCQNLYLALFAFERV
jgi:hypothetical protein